MRSRFLLPASLGFLRHRRIAFSVSGAALLASVVLFFSLGLNYGIDFRGGVMMDIGTEESPADIAALRSRIGALGLGDVQIQRFGEPDNVLIRVEEQSPQAGTEGETAQEDGADMDVVALIRATLGDGVEYRRVEVVGPKVSGELIRSGILAILAAMALVLIYIWFRFEWQFSLGAIMALIHDVVATIGVFSLLRLEFNLSIIAAILTIVGYSLNDTVVIYDRVRENLRKYKKMPLQDLLDLSINQTLSRSLMTSVTTLLALFALYVFGGEVIRGFVFAMIWGVFVGTYSSIFIAAPLLLQMGVKRDWSGLEKKKPA